MRKRTTLSSRWMTLALALAALTGPAWAGEATQSGTVLAVDQAAGTIVLEAMGPWQMKDGKTVVGQQSIAVTPSTRFVEVRRAPGAAPSGWVGDYVESPLGAWQVKPGDFVAVSVQPTKPRATALKITVVNTAQP